MPESRESRRQRRRFNRFPAYRATGGRVTYLADDFRELRIELRLTWLTRNLSGTLFGGSLYAAVDPIYAVLLMRLLGPGYVVWDKAASIRFRKPGRDTLAATFRIEDGEVDAIRAAVDADGRTDRVYRVELVDAQGVVYAEVDKTIYVAARGR
jgi:acyl-coenzyme A thioesterase PaaI-like protein